MKKLLLVLILLLIACPVSAKKNHTERYYQEIWCSSMKGTMEVVMKDRTRCDCILEEYAVEVDFARSKWYEGVTQALHYAMLTGKQPGLLLIIEDESEMKFVEQANQLINHYNLGIKLWVIGYEPETDR